MGHLITRIIDVDGREVTVIYCPTGDNGLPTIGCKATFGDKKYGTWAKCTDAMPESSQNIWARIIIRDIAASL